MDFICLHYDEFTSSDHLCHITVLCRHEPLLTKTMHQVSGTILYTLYPISYLILEHIRYYIVYYIILYLVLYLVLFEWERTVYIAHLNCLMDAYAIWWWA
jgi:hypothetical protein